MLSFIAWFTWFLGTHLLIFHTAKEVLELKAYHHPVTDVTWWLLKVIVFVFGDLCVYRKFSCSPYISVATFNITPWTKQVIYLWMCQNISCFDYKHVTIFLSQLTHSGIGSSLSTTLIYLGSWHSFNSFIFHSWLMWCLRLVVWRHSWPCW